MEFESNVENKTFERLPAWMDSNNNNVVQLNAAQPYVYLSADIMEPGEYVIVVHYFQTNLDCEWWN